MRQLPANKKARLESRASRFDRSQIRLERTLQAEEAGNAINIVAIIVCHCRCS